MKYILKRKTDVRDKRLPIIIIKKFKVFGYVITISRHALNAGYKYRNEINVNISKGWED